MSRQQLARLHYGVVAGCAIGAIVLLVSFYAVVSGAVDHGSMRRTLSSSPTPSPAARLSARNASRITLVAGVAD